MSEINDNKMETEKIEETEEMENTRNAKDEIVPMDKNKIGAILDVVKEPAVVVLGTAASIAVLCVSSKLGGKAVKTILRALKKK